MYIHVYTCIYMWQEDILNLAIWFEYLKNVYRLLKKKLYTCPILAHYLSIDGQILIISSYIMYIYIYMM